MGNTTVFSAPHGSTGSSMPRAVTTPPPAEPSVSPATIPYNPERERGWLLAFVPVIIAGGLLTRYAPRVLPPFLTDAMGDFLYAMLVTILLALAFNRWPRWKTFGVAAAYCFAVEFAQLYHAPWIKAVRDTIPGGLVLGTGFSAFDLLWYLLGAVAGVSLVPRQKKITRQFRSIRK